VSDTKPSEPRPSETADWMRELAERAMMNMPLGHDQDRPEPCGHCDENIVGFLHGVIRSAAHRATQGHSAALASARDAARDGERERVKAVVQWYIDMPGAFDDDGILTDIVEAIDDPSLQFVPWSKEQ
jgi:hypothetical protein